MDAVSAAFEAVPREGFLPPGQVGRAAYDGPLDLGHGQTCSQPRTVAAMLRLLEVRPGDRVAAQVEKSAEALMLYLGALRAGAAFLPLNTAYTPAEIDYFLYSAQHYVRLKDAYLGADPG